MVCVATDSPVLDKVMSNVAEVQGARCARGGRGHRGHATWDAEGHQDPAHRLAAPARPGDHPAAGLLAYYIARERGLNVDQPRNLAKTVTVE